jgi:LPS-assembly protein
VTGGARWDLEESKINQYTLGAGYVDDCFVLAVNYVTSYSYTTNLATPPVLNQTVMLQLGLRTLGSSTGGSGTGGITQ